MTKVYLFVVVLLWWTASVHASLATYNTGVITAGNPAGAVFTGLLSGYTDGINPNPTVSDLTVSMTINGGYNGALYAYLVAPNGTLVVLMNQPGVAIDNIGAYGSGINITLNNNPGATSIQSVTSGSYLTGTYKAAGNLAAFDGSPVNGTWTLFFADLASGGGNATLAGWSLAITPVPEPVETALGVFAAVLLAALGVKYIRTICSPHHTP